jgi:hypothetical protein
MQPEGYIVDIFQVSISSQTITVPPIPIVALNMHHSWLFMDEVKYQLMERLK